jgi:secondary thiamine-phosphate synthase enzyme
MGDAYIPHRNRIARACHGGAMREPGRTSKLAVMRRGRSRQTVLLSDAIIEISTAEPLEFIDLTDRINQFLAAERIVHGEVTIFSRHTTAAIRINEAEDLLLEDFKAFLRSLCPEQRAYHHNDMSRRKPPIAPDERPNAHSHLMHLLLSTSETVPIIDGRLALGTWQRVFLVELDGPRTRQVHLRCAAFRPSRLLAPVRIRAHASAAADGRVSGGTPAGGR